jgi:hypothetical protein
MKSQQRYARGMELGLLAVSVTVGFLLMELAVRYLPLGDQMGWSMVPPVSDRIAKAGAAKPGTARILALGDSMTEWRDNTGESYVRIAEQMLPKTEVVNLAQGGTGLSDYLGNFLRFGARLRADIVLIGLYLGNDLVPSMPPLDTAQAQASLRASPSPPQELDLKRIAKKSVLLNYLFRVGKVYIPSLRSGFFEQMVSQLEAFPTVRAVSAWLLARDRFGAACDDDLPNLSRICCELAEGVFAHLVQRSPQRL